MRLTLGASLINIILCLLTPHSVIPGVLIETLSDAAVGVVNANDSMSPRSSHDSISSTELFVFVLEGFVDLQLLLSFHNLLSVLQWMT